MIRKILTVKEPSLRCVSKDVLVYDKKILELIKDLKETLAVQKDPIGVGLAAPQIGKKLNAFAIKPKDDIKIIINPKIISLSKKNKELTDEHTKLMEGCLSLPNLYGPLKRPDSIKIDYLDEEGNKMTSLYDGFDAQIIQHEIDHLNGILFTDRLLEQKKPLYELVNGEWERVEI